MAIKDLLIEAESIRIGVAAQCWQDIIWQAAEPLIAKGYIAKEYGDAIIANTLAHGPYYIFDEGIAIPHARPECGVKRNGFSLLLLAEPVRFMQSEPVDIIVMFAALDSNSHIEQGIRGIVELLDNTERLARLRAAKTVEEVEALL